MPRAKKKPDALPETTLPDPDTLPTFGARLKVVRESVGLTRKALADKAGVSAGSIRDYEQDSGGPGPLIFLRLLLALGVDSRYFSGSQIVQRKR